METLNRLVLMAKSKESGSLDKVMLSYNPLNVLCEGPNYN